MPDRAKAYPSPQEVFEAQGFLIIGLYGHNYDVGDVLPYFDYRDAQGVPQRGTPVLVIGRATRKEWRAQHKRFLGDANVVGRFTRYVKVVAE